MTKLVAISILILAVVIAVSLIFLACVISNISTRIREQTEIFGEELKKAPKEAQFDNLNKEIKKIRKCNTTIADAEKSSAEDFQKLEALLNSDDLKSLKKKLKAARENAKNSPK